MSLESLMRERIAQNGPLTVAEYMEMALTHPEYGYYMRKDPLGMQGDFITAPEISQIFGELIGAWLAEQWRAMDYPQAALVELGPGRGTLMSDILRATENVPDFHRSVSVHLIEASPALKQKQWQSLVGRHGDMQWNASLGELPEKPWLLVANEFFDALPVRQLVRTAGEWHERLIDFREKKFQFAVAPAACHDIPEGQLPATAKEGAIVEYCPSAVAMTQAISSHVAQQGGAALIIDYGYTEGSRGDTLQGAKAHAYHDVLTEPGNADLTAHVDFAALKHAATESGAVAYGPVPQGAFLKNLGAMIRAVRLCENAPPARQSRLMAGLERLVSVDQMGDLFKAMCIVPPAHPWPEGF